MEKWRWSRVWAVPLIMQIFGRLAFDLRSLAFFWCLLGPLIEIVQDRLRKRTKDGMPALIESPHMILLLFALD